jgi:hypothetical protein
MKTYDRDIDYLGEIGRILRDLTGYSTLAYELIQNADDDGNATRLTFDVREDALIVQHDGIFSDCGDQDAPPNQCPSYLETGDRCDLHSFRRVGGANKSQREETTGAFGIGFTAVYQVTDRPELVTAGHHWHIDETAARAEGIRACASSDCDMCAMSFDGQPYGCRGRRMLSPSSAARHALSPCLRICTFVCRTSLSAPCPGRSRSFDASGLWR